MLDYKKKPQISDFDYYIVLNKKHSVANVLHQSIISPALQKAKDIYGIDFTELQSGEMPSTKKTIYLLYGPTDVLNLDDEESVYLKKLAELSESKINIVSGYYLNNGLDSDAYKQNQLKVPAISSELGVNVIYPDNILLDINIRTTDSDDITDNIICETIRVKYEPVIDLNPVQIEKTDISDEIARISDLYRKYKLWHRAPTDGAVAIFLDKVSVISQTKTDKQNLSFDDFSLISKFEINTNKLFYSGEKLPSSDSPEFLRFKELLNAEGAFPRYLIHFHKDEIIRSERFKDKLTKEKIEYGRFNSGDKMFEEHKSNTTNYLLLREHGVVWWGDSIEEFERFLITLFE